MEDLIIKVDIIKEGEILAVETKITGMKSIPLEDVLCNIKAGGLVDHFLDNGLKVNIVVSRGEESLERAW